MTNRIALGIGLVIVALIGLDVFLQDGKALMFLLRKMLVLIDHLEFWR